MRVAGSVKPCPRSGDAGGLNNDTGSALHFLPALRNADPHGHLSVSWFDRRLSPNSALTDVFAAVGLDPRLTTTPASNVRVTTASSDWTSVSSDIIPNFGDYTDNYVAPSATGATLFIAWSDGRLNDPQPFMASASIN